MVCAWIRSMQRVWQHDLLLYLQVLSASVGVTCCYVRVLIARAVAVCLFLLTHLLPSAPCCPPHRPLKLA